MMKELEDLCSESRSNSCIEHAMGIMEEKRAPENLSERISNISLSGAKQVLFTVPRFSPCKFLYFSHYDPSVFLVVNIIKFPKEPFTS